MDKANKKGEEKSESIGINKEYCRSIIQEILNKAHTIPQKKVIKETPEGLDFADPIGGDSQKNPYMKRAHLYWNSFYIICYDDAGYKMPFTQFCSTFNISIDPKQRVAIYDHIDNNITYNDYENEFIDSTFDDLIDIDELSDTLNNGKSDSQVMNFKPIQEGSRVEYYLKKRNITNYKNIYQANFYRSPDWVEPVLVVMNKKDDKVLGLQVRNLKEGYKRMFKVYNYEHVLEWISPEKVEKMDMNKIILYNKLSYFYNIMNVNFNSTITLFEGYLDSIFFPNSIGVSGVSTDMKILEGNNLDIQYFYDNDEPGWKKSDEKINKGYPVFLWNKLFEDIVEKKGTKDPYYLLNKIKKVKDLNKLACVVSNPFTTLKLNDYFSKDVFDKRYIPKVKSKFHGYKKFDTKK